jgi:hypothetical protein
MMIAGALIALGAIFSSVCNAQSLQDLINEACAPSHYPLLPPCNRNITLEEINNRLHYKLQMMEAEDSQLKNTILSWQKLIGLLYAEPTQSVWNSNKKIALSLSTDLVREQASKAIDAQGALFLFNSNGNPELVRKNILIYLISNGWERERITYLQSLRNQIDSKALFRVELAR